MVKKFLFSSFAALAIFGAGAQADILNDCKEQSGGNFDDELTCISEKVEQNLIDRNNKIHLVLSASVPISSDSSSPDYYNNLDAAFAKAMMNIKLQSVSNSGFKRSSQAALDIIDNTENEENLTKEAKDAAKEQLLREKRDNDYQNILDAILGGVKTKLGVGEGESLNQQQKEQAKAMVKRAIYSEKFSTVYKEGSLDDIKQAFGLVTYATLVHTDKNGASELGVVAYVSDASADLYRALTRGTRYEYEGDKNNCRSAKEVISGFDRKNLLGKVGTVFYRDENCQPALLSFSTHAFKQTNSELAKRLKASAKDKAAMVARDNLSQFIKTNIALEQAYSMTLSDMQELMVEAIEGAIDDNMQVDKGTFESKLTSTFSKRIRANTSGDTKGMTVEKTWYDDLGNVGVVGAAVSYSTGNKEAARAMQEMLQSAKKAQVKPQPKSEIKPVIKSNTSYNRNFVVDDF